VLSVARFFLFGSRDMWFEVPLPFFLRDAVHGLGWERVAVGAVLAVSCVTCLLCRGECCMRTVQLHRSLTSPLIAVIDAVLVVSCIAYTICHLSGF
jgi:hypothetical protein